MRRTDIDLGHRLVPYQEGRDLQQKVHDAVVAGEAPSTILLLEHEPVYTAGRRTHSWERPAGDFVEPGHIPVVDVDRGGKVTWHGPGQLTAYPIVHLAKPIDVIRYVRALEAAVIDLCADFGLEARRVTDRSGVWLPDRHAPAELKKVCALGVRVSRSVTMHGIGLNVNPDLEAFSLDRIVPCGISDAGVTSLSEQLDRSLSVVDLADPLFSALERHLEPLSAQPLSSTSHR